MTKSKNEKFEDYPIFKFSNRRKKLLTMEFLEDFKANLIKVFSENDKKHGRELDNYENGTYIGLYNYWVSTRGFYDALKETCKKHNVKKAIYDYARNLPWYDSDCFDDELVLEMVRKGIIKYDSPEDYAEEDYEEEECEAKYKIVKYCKGYNVVEYDCCREDEKERVENIYSDSDKKLIWID